MRLQLRRPRAALIVAPHPDDEVIGAFWLIAHLRRSRVRVTVLLVTDGAASHPASRDWPRSKLAARRLRESRATLRRHGLPATRLRTLGLPDGALPRLQSRLDLAVSREIARVPGLDLIVGPAPTDDHADHRAVALAMARATTSARRLAYPVWPQGDAAGFGLSVAPYCPQSAKRFALQLHSSQTGAIRDDPRGFAMSLAQIAGFTRGRERFREARR